jgi:hypothetical protein
MHGGMRNELIFSKLCNCSIWAVKAVRFLGLRSRLVKLASLTSRIDMNASLNANAKLSLRGFYHLPISSRDSTWESKGIRLVEPISTRIRL